MSGFAGCGGDDKKPSVLTNTSTSSSSSTGGVAGAGGDGGSGASTSGGGGGSGGGSSTSTSGGGEAGAGGSPTFCENQTKDGNETDVDCGGSCPPCDDLLDCLVASDCQSLNCVALECAPPTCTDLIHNGNETDQDCGGPNCGPCDDGKNCAAPTHCKSGVCTGGVCQVPTCVDTVTNGDETDTDCGGSCTTKCLFGQSCQNPSDCIGNECDSNICVCPENMDIVPSLGGGSYCIDQTEVTYKQYELFYVANPPVSGQIAQCQWNLNYTPAVNWPSTVKELPVVGVNWCEAYAYCAWAQKRLCGKIGGGANAFTDYANANASQWFNACSAQNANTFPYSGNFDLNACYGLEHGSTGLQSVVNQSGVPLTGICVGGTPNLFHMSGNAWEWVDSCNGISGETDYCHLRGGSFNSLAGQLACTVADPQVPTGDPKLRNHFADDVGFRCCI